MSTQLSLGIIMDGNRRWAKARGMPAWEGHRAGADKLKEVVEWAKEHGVSHLTLYALSTENFKRDATELAYLFELIREVFTSYTADAVKSGVRVRVVGDRSHFSDDLQTIFTNIEDATKACSAINVSFALGYGGRAEIVAAANECVRQSKEVSEQTFQDMLWGAHIPPMDILIRPGGERRLSNFFPWHTAYAELFFVDDLWPDFSKSTFTNILEQFSQRQRRMGT